MNALVPRSWFGGDLWDFGRDFDELVNAMFADPKRGAWWPAVESYREDGKLHVKVDLPGVKPEEVEVTVNDGQLTIRGERKSEHEKKRSYREVSYGSFERRFSLPEGVAADKVEARYDKGVLTLTIPLPEAKKPHRIPVAGPSEGVEKAA